MARTEQQQQTGVLNYPIFFVIWKTDIRLLTSLGGIHFFDSVKKIDSTCLFSFFSFGLCCIIVILLPCSFPFVLPIPQVYLPETSKSIGI
jgi:hypothetical protein